MHFLGPSCGAVKYESLSYIVESTDIGMIHSILINESVAKRKVVYLLVAVQPSLAWKNGCTGDSDYRDVELRSGQCVHNA